MSEKKTVKRDNREFYIKDYMQKSKTLLLPLVEERCRDMWNRGLLNTYLFCAGIDEDIQTGHLLVEVKKESEYCGGLDTVSSYETVDSTVLVYSLEGFQQDVEHFINGEYSKFSDEAKRRVLRYFDHKMPPMKPEDVKNGIYEARYYTILYPSVFKDKVTEELVNRYSLYDTYQEAWDAIKDRKELFPEFNLDKETLKKEIIQ